MLIGLVDDRAVWLALGNTSAHGGPPTYGFLYVGSRSRLYKVCNFLPWRFDGEFCETHASRGTVCDTAVSWALPLGMLLVVHRGLLQIQVECMWRDIFINLI